MRPKLKALLSDLWPFKDSAWPWERLLPPSQYLSIQLISKHLKGQLWPRVCQWRFSVIPAPPPPPSQRLVVTPRVSVTFFCYSCPIPSPISKVSCDPAWVTFLFIPAPPPPPSQRSVWWKLKNVKELESCGAATWCAPPRISSIHFESSEWSSSQQLRIPKNVPTQTVFRPDDPV